MNSASNEKSGHKVFPMTYLRKVIFTIDFDKLSEECYSAIIEFIRVNFGFEVTEEFLGNLANRPLTFGTEDHTVQWSISDTTLDILIAQKAYQSFETSLLPLINLAQSFLKSVRREVREISLNKVNLIPVTLSSYTELKANVEQVFTDVLLSQWTGDVYQKSDSSLIYLFKNKGNNGEDIVIYNGFISKDGVDKDQPARYILDITAVYAASVNYNKLEDLAVLLNDEIYNVFINSVSDELKKSMEGV